MSHKEPPKYTRTPCCQWVTTKANDGKWTALSTTETADELNNLERQLAEATNQRDKLAEALRWLNRSMGAKPLVDCANKVRSALATLNQPEETKP